MVIFVRICAVLFALVWLINASFMLASPRAWFRLPKWFTVYGRLREEKHSSGRGAIEVRILGAMLLGAFAWIIYDAFFLGKSEYRSFSVVRPTSDHSRHRTSRQGKIVH